MPPAAASVHIAQTPLVRAAAFCSVLAAVAAFAPAQKPTVEAPSAAPVAAPGLRPVCGQRAIVEGEACIPLPGKNAPLGPAEAHRAPRTAADDTPTAFLPRRPDRPADFNVYTFPVDTDELFVMPRSVDAKAPGEREGINIKVSIGDKVKAATVEGADDTIRVVFVGQDVGVTVATLHAIREGESTRHVLVIYGHLDRPGPGIVAGSRVHNDDVIGFAGDSGSKGVEQLYLEARIVRQDALQKLTADGETTTRARLTDDALSMSTDVRNVFRPARSQ